MTSVFATIHQMMQLFECKIQEFNNDIDNVHMVWLEEIQLEANRMFSSDFSCEPELMPKTPSQKKSTRRRRVSSARQEETRAKRRFSKNKRSNLRGSSVKTLNLIAEIGGIPAATTSQDFTEEPKHSTRRAKQTQDQSLVLDEEPETAPENVAEKSDSDSSPQHLSDTFIPPQMPLTDASVMISAADRRSAENAKQPEPSPGRSATKIAIACTPKNSRRSSVRHSLSLRRSLAGLRTSITHDSIRRASRRSFLKKKARLGNSTSSSNVSEDACCTDTDGEAVEEEEKQVFLEAPAEAETEEPETEEPESSPEMIKQSVEAPAGRVTRAKTQNTMARTSQEKVCTRDSGSSGSHEKESSLRSSQRGKRSAAEAPEGTPRKRMSPPKKTQSVIRPNMKSFLQTVQKNQLLMTPVSLGRSYVIKSFIKPNTPLRVDLKLATGLVERERQKLETLKKKREQEEERKKKMEDEKRRKQEEMKRKRDERLRRVVEARVKEELKEEEKKKKIEQRIAQMDEKNDKLRVERLAEEKAKKKVATKRQEELEQRRKLEEDARRKKIQQAEEEEVRQQKLLAKRRAEEEEQRARKLAEARRAQELKEQEFEKERQAATERQRVEKENVLSFQREKERWEEKRTALEEKRREEQQRLEEERAAKQEQQRLEEERAAKQKQQRLEEERAARQAQQRLEEERAAKQREAATAATAAKNVLNTENTLMKTPVSKKAGLNVTIDIEPSPQSYDLTPQQKKPVVIDPNPETYGMDQNSDDSTDDESEPRKPIPAWAEGLALKQVLMRQYYHPIDLDSFYGEVEPPKLEAIFFKKKPRYYKRTSSAVWHSPPQKPMS